MSNEPSGNSRGLEIGARNWDHPNGLGWQLWRRAQFTGLLTHPIQGYLARVRAVMLRNLAPLASDIRGRWGVGGNSSVDRVGPELPFFLARFPFFRRSTPQHLSVSEFAAATSPAHTSQISLAYRTSPSHDATTSPPPPRTEAGTQHAAGAIAPQGAGGADSAPVPLAASGGIAPSITLARRSLPLQAPMTTVHTVPLNRGTTTVSNAIGERHNPMPASVQRPDIKSSMTDRRSLSALLQPTYEAPAPSLAAERGGESRIAVQRSLEGAAKPLKFEPDRLPSTDLPPAGLPGGSREALIKRSVLAQPGASAATTEGAASIANREATIGTVKVKSIPQGSGVSAEAVSLPGGAMAGVIFRSPETRSPIMIGQAPIAVTHSRGYEPGSAPRNNILARSIFASAKGMTIARIARPETGRAGPNALQPSGVATVGSTLPLSAGAFQQYRQIFAPYLSKLFPSFSGRGFVSAVLRSAYRPAASLNSPARSEEVGVKISVSSGAAEGLIQGKTVSDELLRAVDAAEGRHSTVDRQLANRSQQPQTTTVPVVKIQSDQAGEKIATKFDTAPGAQESGVTMGPSSVEAHDSIDRKTFGGEQLRTADAPDAQRSTVARQRSSRGQQLPTVDVWPVGRAEYFAARHAAPVFTARKTAVGLRPTAMPLSIEPVLKRGNWMAGSKARRHFTERATTPKISRAEYHGSSSLDNPILGEASGAGIIVTSGAASRAARTREASENNLVFGPLASRVPAEAIRSSVDSTRTRGMASAANFHSAELSITNGYDSLSADASIFRAAPAGGGFGAMRLSNLGRSLQGWLPLHQGGLSSGGVFWAMGLIQRAAGPLARPLLVARWAGIRAAVGDRLPGVTTSSQATQLTETSSSRRIPAVTAVKSSGIHSQTVDLTQVLAPMRPAATVGPNLLRRSNTPAIQEQHAATSAASDTDMPFAALSIAGGERGLTVGHHANGTSLQAAPQQTASAATRALPIGAEAEPVVVETPPAAAQPQIDLDEIVEKAWQKLMRKLTIEQERRGYSRWS